MAKITGATVRLKSGDPVKADCYGNNAAIICPVCGKNPVLIIARPDQKGSCKQKPAVCDCGTNIWFDPPADALVEPIKVVTLDTK